MVDQPPSNQSPSKPPDAARDAPLGDLGRRLTLRRGELGLSREETASRTGMAVSYIRYLEEHPGAAPDAGIFRRLAGALSTTVAALAGGSTGLPAGTGRASRNAEFTGLTAGESRSLLRTHGVGRIAVSTSEGPAVVPVNYSVMEGVIVFRTAPGTTPSLAAGHRVAFEVDRVDDALSEGWSVLVRGDAHVVTDPEAARLLTELAHSTPWSGGERDLWIRIDPVAVTGRRITA
ncbi:pyridoxamine 5'-phosphate oxidase family protein [Streptomyces tauricus]|uniref:Pyridoxamine 5'-phosphate oxidase family protein n=1 Tax=Streptomyces tauricus TaxID=68274 RepID=A0ABZ1JB59_9ACTN|nr:pyridoxamine 5'-phosphate oxidase family protein [Streptomyces tauricus]